MTIESDVVDFQYFNLPGRYFTSLDMPMIRADIALIERIVAEHVIVEVSDLHDRLTVQIVAEKDEPGIFLRVAAILYSHGICILKATIFTGKKDTIVIDHFVVHPQTERARLDLACTEIRDALINRTVCTPVLCQADSTDLAISCMQSDNDDALVTITAKEQAGFLYRVSKIFADLDLNLTDAEINTSGDQIADTFRVVTSDRKMPSLGKLNQLRETLLKAFAG